MTVKTLLILNETFPSIFIAKNTFISQPDVPLNGIQHKYGVSMNNSCNDKAAGCDNLYPGMLK